MKRKLLVLLMLLVSYFGKAKDVIIKISINDCKNCTVGLNKVFQKYNEYTIVLESSYSADSLDIYDKYNLNSKKNHIVWSDSLYNRISSNKFSEIFIFEDDKKLYGSTFPEFSMSLFDHILQLNDKKEIELCDYHFPKTFEIKNNTNNFLVTNLVTDKKYVYHTESSQIDTFKVSDKELIKVYQLHFSENYKKMLEEYLYLNTKFSQTKPTLTALCLENDSMTKAILLTYRIEIKGNDTNAEKVFTIIEYKNGMIHSICNLDLTHKKNYGFDEYSLMSYNSKIYILCSNLDDRSTDKKIIAEFELKNNTYVFSKFLNFQLPDVYIKSGYNYNMMKFISFNQFATFPLSDFIVDVEKERKIKIPFDSKIQESNENLLSQKSFKMNFGIWDIKFDKISKQFYILYNFVDDFYIGIFKDGDTQFSKNIKLMNYKESEITPALSYDCKQYIYKKVGDKCLSFQIIE